MNKITRRDVLQRGAILLGAGALAACASKVVTEVVRETVVVEVEKEKVVKETVVVEGDPKVVEKIVVATEPPKPQEQPYELRIHTRVGVDLDQYYETVLDEFKQIVPNATVVIEAVPGGVPEYAAKMLVIQVGGQLGDAMWSASRAGFNRRFMGMGMTKPLDDLIAAENFDLGQYYPNCIEEARYEGEVMALPHISEPGNIGLVMNLDLLEEAGVEPITWDSSLEDLINAATAVIDTSGDKRIFGFALGTGYFNWVTTVRSFGGDLLNPEGTQCVLDDEKALAAVQFLYDCVYTYEVAPTPGQIETDLPAMFQGGSLAMTSGWPIQASQWPDMITDFRMDSTMIPAGPVARGSLLNQHMMSVTSATKHLEGAWEWVKWTGSRKFSLDRALKGLGGPVGMPAVWHDPELMTKFPSWREWARVMDDVGPNYTAANLRGKELEDVFTQNIMAIMVQEVGVQAGLERVRDEVQKVLDASFAG